MFDTNENINSEQEEVQSSERKPMEKKNATPEEYGASNIQLLEGIAQIRKKTLLANKRKLVIMKSKLRKYCRKAERKRL